MHTLILLLLVISFMIFGDFIVGVDAWSVVRMWAGGTSSLGALYGDSVPLLFWALVACFVVALWIGVTMALALWEIIRRDAQVETTLGDLVDRDEAGPMMRLAFGLTWLAAARKGNARARAMHMTAPFIIPLIVAAACCATFWALLRFALPMPTQVIERGADPAASDFIRRLFVTFDPMIWAGGYAFAAMDFWAMTWKIRKLLAQTPPGPPPVPGAMSFDAPRPPDASHVAPPQLEGHAPFDAPRSDMPASAPMIDPIAPRTSDPIIDPIDPPTIDPMPGPLSAPPPPSMPPAPGPSAIVGPPLAPPSPKPWAMPAPPADEPSDPAPADDPSIQDPSIHDPADDPAPEMGDELRTVLNSALSALKGRWFDEAERRAKVALSMDPTCARAHVYELMAVLRASSEEELLDHPSPIERHPLFQRALSFARGEDRQRLLAIAAIQRSGDPIV